MRHVKDYPTQAGSDTDQNDKIVRVISRALKERCDRYTNLLIVFDVDKCTFAVI